MSPVERVRVVLMVVVLMTLTDEVVTPMNLGILMILIQIMSALMIITHQQNLQLQHPRIKRHHHRQQQHLHLEVNSKSISKANLQQSRLVPHPNRLNKLISLGHLDQLKSFLLQQPHLMHLVSHHHLHLLTSLQDRIRRMPIIQMTDLTLFKQPLLLHMEVSIPSPHIQHIVQIIHLMPFLHQRHLLVKINLMPFQLPLHNLLLTLFNLSLKILGTFNQLLSNLMLSQVHLVLLFHNRLSHNLNLMAMMISEILKVHPLQLPHQHKNLQTSGPLLVD